MKELSHQPNPESVGHPMPELDERRDVNLSDRKLDALMAGFSRMEKRLDKMNSRFEKLEEKFDQIEKRLDKVDKRLDAIDSDVKSLAKDVYETKGRISQMPSTWTIVSIVVTTVIAVMGVAFAILRFGSP